MDDYGALEKMVFNIRKYDLLTYQWTYIDVKTKTRFLAYSHTLECQFGTLFMELIITWLRIHGIDTPIRFQADNGMEFCSGSKRKEEELNTLLKDLNASFISIPTGKKYLQGIVERSHRTDDEEFYRPHLERIRSQKTYLYKAQQWQDTCNSLRQSWVIGMNGKTPKEKLESCSIRKAKKIPCFPIIVLDDLFSILKTGNYLFAHYLILPRRFLYQIQLRTIEKYSILLIDISPFICDFFPRCQKVRFLENVSFCGQILMFP